MQNIPLLPQRKVPTLKAPELGTAGVPVTMRIGHRSQWPGISDPCHGRFAQSGGLGTLHSLCHHPNNSVGTCTIGFPIQRVSVLLGSQFRGLVIAVVVAYALLQDIAAQKDHKPA